MELTFWIPVPPDNANAREHWAVANGKKRRYLAELAKRCAVRHGFPAVPASPVARAELRIVWHYPNGRHHIDQDNATRRLKPAIDFLVRAGFLVNDTPKHLVIHPIAIAVGRHTPPLCSVQLLLTALEAGTGAPPRGATMEEAHARRPRV